MERRLLDYIPDLEIAGAAVALPAPPRNIDEDSEMAFAARLLEVQDGAGLDAFLAALVADVGAGAAAAPGTPLGRALVAGLRRAARAVLPIRSGPAAAPAGRRGGPPGELKTRAARLFGIELEGLSPEDKEFEVARHLVRFAAAAAAGATAAPGGQPQTQVRAALLQAARQHAPGLLRGAAAMPAPSGRWRRQGKHIVVLNC